MTRSNIRARLAMVRSGQRVGDAPRTDRERAALLDARLAAAEALLTLHERRNALRSQESTARKRGGRNAEVAADAAARAAKARAMKARDPTLTHAQIAESIRGPDGVPSVYQVGVYLRQN